MHGIRSAVEIPATNPHPNQRSETNSRRTSKAKTTAESMTSIESSSLKTWIDQNVSDCDIRQPFNFVTATVKECDELVYLAISLGLEKSVSLGLEKSVSVLSEHVESFLLHA